MSSSLQDGPESVNACPCLLVVDEYQGRIWLAGLC